MHVDLLFELKCIERSAHCHSLSDSRYSVPNPRYQGKGLFSHNKSRSADGSKRRAVTQHPPLAVDPSIPGSAQMPPSMVSGEDAPETLELLKGITGEGLEGWVRAVQGVSMKGNGHYNLTGMGPLLRPLSPRVFSITLLYVLSLSPGT